MFQNCPFTIVKNAGDDKFKISIEIDSVTKLYMPEEILSHLLQKLYKDAKDSTGEDHSVVLCVPGTVYILQFYNLFMHQIKFYLFYF